METRYLLHHIYRKDGFEEVKYIGIFSNRKIVDSTITRLVEKPGFRDWPPECFQITPVQLDVYNPNEFILCYEE